VRGGGDFDRDLRLRNPANLERSDCQKRKRRRKAKKRRAQKAAARERKQEGGGRRTDCKPEQTVKGKRGCGQNPTREEVEIKGDQSQRLKNLKGLKKRALLLRWRTNGST